MGEFAVRVMSATRRFARRALLSRVTDRSWRGQAISVIAALGLMIFMVRVLGAGWPKRFAIFFPDSFSFKDAAKLTPFSPAFYAAERPIAFPMLLFVLGRSTVLTVVVQTLLYGLAYIVVAIAAWRILSQRAAAIVCAFLLITIGLEPRFALWNTHILSESIGMTLAILSVVGWWRFSARPTQARLHWAGALTTAWLCARDSNVPPWVAVGVPALLISSFWWRTAGPRLRRALRYWGVASLLVCIGIGLAQAANGRDRYATLNNVGTRVLPNPEITHWFVDEGMPLDAALLKRTGSNSFDNNWDMLRSPDLQKFRDWADGSGQRVMLVSYVRFAPHWINSLYADLPVLLRSDEAGYDAFGVAARLADATPAQINGPTTRTGLLVWTVIASLGLIGASMRKRGLQAAILGMLLASSFVDLYLAYIGDSVEVQRHMVGPLSRMALVMVICFGVGLDVVVERVRDLFVPANADVAHPGDETGPEADSGSEADDEVDAPSDLVESTSG